MTARTFFTVVLLGLCTASCQASRPEEQEALPLSPKETLQEQLFSLWAGNITLLDVEEKLYLDAPVTMIAPTVTDPLWWFVYKHEGFIIEIGTNTEHPVYTPDAVQRELFYYTGFFKISTPEEYQTKAEYSTSCFPTTGKIDLSDRFSQLLLHYDMRKPISIKGIELKLT